MARDTPNIIISPNRLTTFSVEMLKQWENITTLSYEMKNLKDMINQTEITDYTTKVLQNVIN